MCHCHRPRLSSELRNKKEEQEKLIQQLVTYALVCVLLECLLCSVTVVIKYTGVVYSVTCSCRVLLAKIVN